MREKKKNIIIYNTSDGKASILLYAKDSQVWMNQNQLAELFDTSKQNIGQHISNILEDNELDVNSVVKDTLQLLQTERNTTLLFTLRYDFSTKLAQVSRPVTVRY